MKKDKKILIKFIAIAILALAAGMLMGYFSSQFESDISGILTIFLDSLVIASPVLMPVSLLFAGLAFRDYRRGKQAAAEAIASDDEELYEKADKILENALKYTMYMTIYSFAVFGIMTSGFGGLFRYSNFVPVMAAVGLFLVCLFAMTFLQSAIVKQVQLLNPEKQGNVLDTKFHKDWFESCDEAEKALIGAASYKSYKATSKAVIAAWLVLVFAGFMLPIGPLPSIIVAVIWFVQYYSYIQGMKENEKK